MTLNRLARHLISTYVRVSSHITCQMTLCTLTICYNTSIRKHLLISTLRQIYHYIYYVPTWLANITNLDNIHFILPPTTSWRTPMHELCKLLSKTSTICRTSYCINLPIGVPHDVNDTTDFGIDPLGSHCTIAHHHSQQIITPRFNQ